MQFNWKNLGHLFAAIMVLLSFLVFIGLPLVSLMFPMMNTNSLDQIGDFQGTLAVAFEIVLLLIQIVMVVFLFVLVPFLWYRLVNKFSIKEIWKSMQLSKEKIDIAFLWGIITAIMALSLVIVIGVILSAAGIADENASNIQDLELFFSLPSILILISCQPIAEEIGAQHPLAEALLGQGLVLEKKGDTSAALTYYERALTVAEPIRLRPVVRVATSRIEELSREKGEAG